MPVKRFNLLFIKPAQNTRSQSFTFSSQCDMSSSNSNINQREMLILTFPPSREVILADSSTIRICTGASLANLFIPSPAAALPTFKANSRSVITTNFQGCALQAEGAKRPPLKSSPTSPLLPDVLYHTPGHSAGKVPIAESLYIPYYLY